MVCQMRSRHRPRTSSDTGRCGSTRHEPMSRHDSRRRCAVQRADEVHVCEGRGPLHRGVQRLRRATNVERRLRQAHTAGGADVSTRSSSQRRTVHARRRAVPLPRDGRLHRDERAVHAAGMVRRRMSRVGDGGTGGRVLRRAGVPEHRVNHPPRVRSSSSSSRMRASAASLAARSASSRVIHHWVPSRSSAMRTRWPSFTANTHAESAGE